MELIVGFLLLSFGFFMGWVLRSRLPGIPDIDQHYPQAAPSPHRMATLTDLRKHPDFEAAEFGAAIEDAEQRSRIAAMQFDAEGTYLDPAYPPGATADQVMGIDTYAAIAMDLAMQLPIAAAEYPIPIQDLPETIPYDDPLIGTILQALREGVAEECNPLYLDAKGLTRCKVHGNRAACPKPNLAS